MRTRRNFCLVTCAALIAASLSFGGEAKLQAAQGEDAQEAGAAQTAQVQTAQAHGREVLNFDTDWLYSNVDYENGSLAKLDDTGFEKVSVPHANTILTTHKGNDFPEQIASYRFISWYRRHFTLPESYAGKDIRVEFEGVATIADVYLNGKLLANHKGAYTGFTVDITDAVYTDGRDNVLAVHVDSRRQPEIPPEGGSVDYCLFGGIVRDVNLIVTDPVYVERTFVTTPDLSDVGGVVHTQVDIRNNLETDKTYTVETAVVDMEGKTVTTASERQKLAAGKETTVEVETKNISRPHLWNLDDPYLYTLVTTVKDGNTEVDAYETTFGMRYFEFETGPDDGSLYLNGKKTEIVGINRHEQWPWIGRAVPDKLQRQDADLIKATGINAVRCSHYPQDPSFLERCDEIGLLVFAEPPGWQHVGDDEWKENFKENLRELILRDRNHPSIISWGPRPNESVADLPFNRECEKLAKELDPTRPTHGVRWEYALPGQSDNPDDQEVVNDILTVNYRYPENPPHIPYIVTEHSNDWGGDGMPGVSDSRAQAFIDSFAQVLDYYYGNDKVAGGFGWSMFDYNNEVNYTNTGYLFYSGLYDIFRNEKPVAWLYRTQMDADESEPMVYIANNWTKDTAPAIYVMSNCDEVELFVNGVSKGRIRPNKYTSMPHPIFSFTGVTYEEGELKAVGYLDGEEAAEAVRTTPGEPVGLIAVPDYDTLTADGTDMTSVAVAAVDANGNIVPFAENPVTVTQKSGAETKLITEDGAKLEGGQLAFLVQAERDKTGKAVFEVTSPGLASAECEIEIGAFQADNLVPASGITGKIDPDYESSVVVNDDQKGAGDNQIQYVGGNWGYTEDGICYQGDNSWSETKDEYLLFPFTGTSVRYYGTVAPNHGIAGFSIDDGQEKEVDFYRAARAGDVLVYESGQLEAGRHVLKVRVTGEKNAASTGYFVTVDRIEVPSGSGGAADKEALSALVEQTKAKGLQAADYTRESWLALQEALAEAEDAIAYGKTRQETVDAVQKALQDAIDGLTPQKRVEDIFNDVGAGDWHRDAVQYVYDRGIMQGLKADVFGPAVNLSRGQFATILYRMEDEPTVAYAARFSDVPDDAKLFYRDAVIWASGDDVGIITGYTDGAKKGMFGPADLITREQMATMMYRYAGYKKYDTDETDDLSGFSDGNKVSPFADREMKWAVGAGLITGNKDGSLAPQGTASRAVCATIIQRFLEKTEK